MLKKDSILRSTNCVLNRNLLILMEVLGTESKLKLTKDLLLKKGYNFDYLTRIYVTKKGNLYRFCYDVGLLDLDDGFCLVVKEF